MRVLVVDDDADIGESTVMLLELSGHEARHARSGLEVTGTLGSFAPDVVLQDVNMPGLDLQATVRACRAAVPGVKVMLFTGSVDGEALVEEAGADGVLAKPFHVDELLSLLGA